MPLDLTTPLSCLITAGETTGATTPESEEFARLTALVAAAVAAGVSLIQLREKNLPARTLYELAARSSDLARGSRSRVLVNDRADIARAAACDGVHLAANSLAASTVRRIFGHDFIVGVSTHSLAEAREARDAGADFVIFGPVFDTPSKRAYGRPLGLDALADAARTLAPFPVVAVGGVARENLARVFASGASGVAAIRMFDDPATLEAAVRAVESAAARPRN
ncbi:MAG TPA: thiamine phosphate synthase [Pyrinomonadaceae bacterium]|nr:thiamine phosphate synthase [Pyrinomonadaceae bacterium]